MEKSTDKIEVSLVHFDHPELMDYKETTTQNKQQGKNVSVKNVCSSDSGEDVAAAEAVNCDDVLNRILPPREWEKDGKFWRQKISKQPATKTDVKKLGYKLDTYLKQYKAREVGICPIKREIYSQCFNEIIRQETLNCAERGLMLIQIRDEINMTMDAYQGLYESTIAYGIRKMLLREHNKSELGKRAEQIRSENEVLEAELAQTIAMTEKLERETAEAREAEIKRHDEEMSALKKENQRLKDKLQSIIAPIKSNAASK